MNRKTGIYPIPHLLLEENKNQEIEWVLTVQKRKESKLNFSDLWKGEKRFKAAGH